MNSRRLGRAAAAALMRTPEIMADAAHAILTKDGRTFTGQFCIDDLVLCDAGVRGFSQYAAAPGTKHADLRLDFFVPDDVRTIPR